MVKRANRQDNGPDKRTRLPRPYPSCPFAESETFAKSVADFGSGHPIRRLSLFDQLSKSPDSSSSRGMITNAGKYGLIKGGYNATTLELGAFGIQIFGETKNARDRALARIDAAILNILPFKSAYEKFINNRLPTKEALRDIFLELEVNTQLVPELIDIFILNLKEVGLLKLMSGVERVLAVDAALDDVRDVHRNIEPLSADTKNLGPPQITRSLITTDAAAFETTCFYVTPIGEQGSEVRKHSDLVMGSIIEPALSEFQLKLVRADGIDKPGVITNQIYEYLTRSRLVIADLSYHNPNVFYELAVRHSTGKPIVELIRSIDKIPFDVSQNRVLVMDLTDIYSFVPNMDLYKSRLAMMIRTGLSADSSDNPLSQYLGATNR